MSEQRFFEDVAIGDNLPNLVETIGSTDLFYFSATTYNGHRIHYDWRWAVEKEGHSDIVVHGPLQAAIMTRLLTDWMGPTGRLVSVNLSHRASAWPDIQLTFGGYVVEKHEEQDAGLVVINFQETDEQGNVLMPGTAKVALPRRAA